MIVQDGLRRMHADQEDVYYYLTTLNENYEHPAMPEGAEEGIKRGMYLLRAAEAPKGRGKAGPRVQLLGCGAILREVIAAADLLRDDWGVAADVWSCPSFTELGRDAQDVERWNLLHPAEAPRKSWVEQCLGGADGPVVASTDYMRMFANQIRPYVRQRYRVLGTDGFGRSDYRRRLRDFFEVDRRWVTLAALESLALDGAVPVAKVGEAIKKYGIDPDKPNPARV